MTNTKALDPVQVTRPCHECGGTMVGTRQVYDYVECGLSSVRLNDVLVFECKCGLRSPEIPAISDLHCFIALDLLRKQSLLSGEEIKFLRKMAGLSQKELASIMGIDPTRPSKWEKDSASKEGDRLLRTIFLLGMIQNITRRKDTEVIKSLAAEKFIQELDIRDLLKSIDATDKGPKDIEVRSNATGDDPWFLPGLGESNLAVA